MANILKDILKKATTNLSLLPSVIKQTIATQQSIAARAAIDNTAKKTVIPKPVTVDKKTGAFQVPNSKEVVEKLPEMVKQTVATAKSVVKNIQTRNEYLGNPKVSTPPPLTNITLPHIGGLDKQWTPPVPIPVSEMLKWNIELPEKVVNTVKDIYSTIKTGSIAPKTTNYKVDSLADDYFNFYNSAKQKGFSEGGAKGVGALYSISSAALALATAGKITTNMFQGLAKNTALGSAKVRANVYFRNPQTPEEFFNTANKTATAIQNMPVTEQATAWKDFYNNAYTYIGTNGKINPRDVKDYITNFIANKPIGPVGELFNKPVLNQAPGVGLLTQNAGEMFTGKPTTAATTQFQPAVGLSVKEVGNQPDINKIVHQNGEIVKYKGKDFTVLGATRDKKGVIKYMLSNIVDGKETTTMATDADLSAGKRVTQKKIISSPVTDELYLGTPSADNYLPGEGGGYTPILDSGAKKKISIGGTQLKQLFEVPGFKENPYLTVSEDADTSILDEQLGLEKSLNYISPDGKTHFSLNPIGLGLDQNEISLLPIGKKIKIDKNYLSGGLGNILVFNPAQGNHLIEGKPINIIPQPVQPSTIETPATKPVQVHPLNEAYRMYNKRGLDSNRAQYIVDSLITNKMGRFAGDTTNLVDKLPPKAPKTIPQKKISGATQKEIVPAKVEKEVVLEPSPVDVILDRAESSLPADVLRFVAKPMVLPGGEYLELDFSNTKDVIALDSHRETITRNLEWAFRDPKQLRAIMKNIIDPISTNNMALKEWKAAGKKYFRYLSEAYNIHTGSTDSSLVQQYGEKAISLEKLKTQTKNWEKVVKYADEARSFYDGVIDAINEMRIESNLKPIPKLPNYFRHMGDFKSLINSKNGIFSQNEDLPASFKEGYQYIEPKAPTSTTFLHRKGGTTKLDAVTGLENYIDSVATPLFHTDSVLRIRALIKYLKASEEVNPIDVRLPNLINELTSQANLMSGKAVGADIQLMRNDLNKSIGIIKWLTHRWGGSAVVGNLSVQISNFIAVGQTFSTSSAKAFTQGTIDAIIYPIKKKIYGTELWDIDGQRSEFLFNRSALESPADNIDPTSGELFTYATNGGFRFTDRFSARMAVYSKYQEGIDQGKSPEQAIYDADAYARKSITDRSFGNLPSIYQVKALQPITQFSVEPNNQFSFMTKDMPKMYKNPWRRAVAYVMLFVFWHYLNNVFEKVFGRRPAVDPIYTVETLAGKGNTVGQGLPTMGRIYKSMEQIAGDLPFTDIVWQRRIPLSGIAPTGADFASVWAGDMPAWKLLKNPAIALIPGGVQAKKTITGLAAFNEGEVKTKAGNVLTKIEPSVANFLRATIAGPNSFPEVRAAYNELDRINSLKDSSYRQSVDKNRKIDEMISGWGGKTTAQIESEAKVFLTNNPLASIQNIKDRMKIVEVTSTDKALLTLPVTGGYRAKQIIQELSFLDTDEQRDSYFNYLMDKKIITAEVYKQMKELLK